MLESRPSIGRALTKEKARSKPGFEIEGELQGDTYPVRDRIYRLRQNHFACLRHGQASREIAGSISVARPSRADTGDQKTGGQQLSRIVEDGGLLAAPP